MILDGNNLNETEINTSICIIGGGVAGLTIAHELRNQSSSVLVVESGTNQFSQEAQNLCEPDRRLFPRAPFPDALYSRLRFLGGSSNHWENNTSPLSPIDFEKRDWVKNSGWPVPYEEIESFYIQAQPYCGVGQDGYETHHWAQQTRSSDPFQKSKALETQIAKMASPPVRFYDHLKRRLDRLGKLQILVNSNLVDIDFDFSRKKVESCTLISNSGQTLKIIADRFVFAMGGLENPRMLLAFNQKYDNKIGNQHGCVGKYFMEHPTPRAAHLYANGNSNLGIYQDHAFDGINVTGFIALSEKELKEARSINLRMPLIPRDSYSLSSGISSAHIILDEIADSSFPDDIHTHAYNILSDLDLLVEAVARKQFDTTLFDSAKKFAGYEIPMMIEQTPERSNSVYLSAKKDKFGIPKIGLSYRVSEQDKLMVWRSLERAAKEIGEMGIGRLRLLKERSARVWGDQLGFSNHHMGTTRMADSPLMGVVDSDCKVFGTENLYVAGSSVFPTGGHVPPTLTIVALSIRLAEHLKGSS